MKLVATMMLALVLLPSVSAFAGKDPEIDHLLSKLPPPEKFVDPAMSDPLAKKMISATKARNFGAAFDDSRQLATRYPTSLGAQMVYGAFAQLAERFPEASTAYRKALTIKPNFAAAAYGVGLAEFSQEHYQIAFSHFRNVTRLAPTADLGWIGSSACAERLGRQPESLQYARRATTVAPTSPAAWIQLGRAESLSGNKTASTNAYARADQLNKKAQVKQPDRSSVHKG
jgi:tetratricopeptide (TPR) repeat protein